MEIKLQEDLREIFTEASRQQKRLPVSIEAVVPDSMEDLAKLAALRATVYLKAKEPGLHGLTVSGELRAVALGIGENGSLYAIPMSRSFELEFDQGASLPENQCQVSLSITSQEARLQNPRKISAVFEVTGDLRCFEAMSLAIGSAAEERPGLHLNYEDKTTGTVSTTAEKSFVFSEQIPLPQRPELLYYAEPSLLLEDVQPVGSRVIVKGRLRVDLGWAGEDNTPGFQSLSFPFSQIMELGEDDLQEFCATALPCSAYMSLTDTIGGDRALEVEVHGLVQLTGVREQRLHLPVDAYSNQAPLNLTREEQRWRSIGAGEPVTITARTGPELPEDWQSPVSLIPGPVQLEKTGTQLRGTIPMDLIYRTGTGELASIRRNLSAQGEIPEGTRMISLETGEPELTESELRLPIRVLLCRDAEERMERLTGMELDEEHAYDLSRLPSVILARTDGESLWELARRYHASPERILSMNGEDPGQSMLLVVREAVPPTE